MMKTTMDNYNLLNFEYSKNTLEKSSNKLFNNRIWGIDEVCSFTKLAKGTIYNLVSRGDIPYRKRHGGRRLVFIPSEVIAWFKGEL